ncbi:MAG: bifunctional diaminohydroxyphosphoribosylaminopyrimidine deaminase/5-amino-6-(5-phosphoribosylamino)uracil reductase RibD [Bacteroidales bacterium]|jgi:diaminohydroxyphosphoribosylaminopyrimidine deaminase/5-amino-6-(5-phosphoribosylamino)uracil reductase|nr:bifunctional diaminohydroxyphosphoribosylaminopyrimidine deaminase/5-amino-6-(5-phosphoribosylamino)uracil reductase RibD [Bacteroidales bacterium]
MIDENLYMRRCFHLALLGSGNVSPNPLVGAVIVHNGRIIGEGYHKKYGDKHAEVMAVEAVKDKSLLAASTLYVNLEPCCHWGHTPPCAEMIIKHKIPKVIIANRDTNPKVSGGGVKILKENGIEVICGILEREGRYLNRRFFTFHEKHRPYVILKWAETIDGFMDTDRQAGIDPVWISNDVSKVYVHKQRAENDAIFVGFNTILRDNPHLNVRFYFGQNPVRLTFARRDSINAETKLTHHFFDNSQPTVIFPQQPLNDLLTSLYDRKINSLIVEGGRHTLEMFIEQNLWDEAFVIVGNKVFERGLKAPVLNRDFHHIYLNDNTIKHYILQPFA